MRAIKTDVDDLIYEQATESLNDLLMDIMKQFNVPRAYAKEVIVEAAQGEL